jgi:hypothetical protein
MCLPMALSTKLGSENELALVPFDGDSARRAGRSPSPARHPSRGWGGRGTPAGSFLGFTHVAGRGTPRFAAPQSSA